MERKIIGYKLQKTENAKLAVAIEGFIQTGFSNITDRVFTFKDNQECIDKWKRVEVLEDWFQVVYEEEYKVGDYIYCHSDLKMLNSDAEEATKNKLYKVVKISHNGFDFTNNSKSSHTILFNDNRWFRKATPKEIQAATERYVTLSNGKEVRINKEGVLAEGKIIYIGDLQSLLNLKISKIHEWNVELTDARYKIGCWAGVTMADIELIIKNYNEIV